MTRRLTLLALMAVAGCEGGAMLGADAGGAVQERLVIGSSMSFEDCRAGGGLIIRDAGSPMIACDPSVKRRPVPQTAPDTAVDDTDLNATLEMQDLAEAR
ncbi:hypothetical protein EU805_12155 [Salipiger sp. IMCC34102]|uniref:hypothetical protein n=1 Tax=Salipiger sp. IMCC34102 TaxID=2510647 RepID=UPI00101D55EB|nr:hypothetical protein [Salipiger sp. IMCC34102]RYH01933.1 hypothetical protein EU805_12155 [Salipiger sp. IMCC34102]